ncbi:MAG: hypothetical protein R3192_17785 [Woeseiaceae bacterium]|nr:hypothetical protein [Woeseiaceae bacterium]
MTQFEFVLVFISIVLAFAVSDILSNWGEQVRLRKQIRHYPLHSAWMGLLLIIMMVVWWSLWVLREHPQWTFLQYMVLMVPYLTLALIAYILTPNFDDGERDIKHYYFENSRWIFSLAAFYFASWTFFSLLVLGNPIDEPGSLTRFCGMALMLALAIWNNERFHAAAVIVAYLLQAIWLLVTLSAA